MPLFIKYPAGKCVYFLAASYRLAAAAEEEREKIPTFAWAAFLKTLLVLEATWTWHLNLEIGPIMDFWVVVLGLYLLYLETFIVLYNKLQTLKQWTESDREANKKV